MQSYTEDLVFQVLDFFFFFFKHEYFNIFNSQSRASSDVDKLGTRRRKQRGIFPQSLVDTLNRKEKEKENCESVQYKCTSNWMSARF